MKHTKKEGSAWTGGWGSRENPAPCRCPPRKNKIAAKMSINSFRVPEVFESPSCSRAPFWRENVQSSGEQVSFRNTRAWGSSKHEFTFDITGNRDFSGSKLEPMKNCLWIGTFLEIFIIPIWAGSEIGQQTNSSNHVGCLQESRGGWLKW